jgi:hypothetical protein
MIENCDVCIKREDKETHHPHLILDWGYTPVLLKGKGISDNIVIT